MGWPGRTCAPPPPPMRGDAPAAAPASFPFTPPLLTPPALQALHHQGPGEEPPWPPLPLFPAAARAPPVVGHLQQNRVQVCLQGSRREGRGGAGRERAGTCRAEGSGGTAR